MDDLLDVSPVFAQAATAPGAQQGGAMVAVTTADPGYGQHSGTATPVPCAVVATAQSPGAGSGRAIVSGAGETQAAGRRRLRVARMLSVMAGYLGVGSDDAWFTAMVEQQGHILQGLRSIDANDLTVFLIAKGVADKYVQERIREATERHPYSVAVMLSMYREKPTFQVEVQLHPQWSPRTTSFLVYADRVRQPAYPPPEDAEQSTGLVRRQIAVLRAWALFCAWFASTGCKLHAPHLRWVTVQPEEQGAWGLYVQRTTGPLQTRAAVSDLEPVLPALFPDLREVRAVAPLVSRAIKLVTALDVLGQESAAWEDVFISTGFFIHGDRDHGVTSHEGVSNFSRRVNLVPGALVGLGRLISQVKVEDLEAGAAKEAMITLKTTMADPVVMTGIVILGEVLPRIGRLAKLLCEQRSLGDALAAILDILDLYLAEQAVQNEKPPLMHRAFWDDLYQGSQVLDAEKTVGPGWWVGQSADALPPLAIGRTF